MKRDKSFNWRRVAADDLDLQGKAVAVIGGTGGIGRALSRLLAARGARVTVVGQTFRDSGVAGIEFVQADLNLMREAQRVAESLPAEKLDLVVFTTGIMASPKRQQTSEGLERDMAVSYLSRLAILRGIAGRLGVARANQQQKTRVFVMGYPGIGQVGELDDLNAEKSYNAMRVHMNTVAGNEMLVLCGARRYPQLDVFGLNPGFVKTNIRRNFLGGNRLFYGLLETVVGLVTPSADDYARRIVPLLAAPELADSSGALFNNHGEAILASPGLSTEHTSAFLEASQALVDRALQAR